MSLRQIILVALGSSILYPFVFSATDTTKPVVVLDQGVFTGTKDNTVNKFLGIPFGKTTAPPNRFQPPKPAGPYLKGQFDATKFGPACPQQDVLSGLVSDPTLPPATAATLAKFINTIVVTGPTSEDCLNLNVYVPAGTQKGANLPVIAWVFGGGFQVGAGSLYDGTNIVARSVALKEPVIVVTLNYRVSAWGFVGSTEINNAGASNLGLRDQRAALQWVKQYITQFGGNPNKVTLWGESAGANSVGFQMVLNNGNTENLFHATVMESGSAFPPGNITDAQPFYDQLVKDTGCQGSKSTLDCLRNVDGTVLAKAINLSPSFFQSIVFAWQPRVDGKLLSDAPLHLIEAGKVANIPFMSGDLDDEGTVLSMSATSILTDADFTNFVATQEFPLATPAQVNQLVSFYPSDPAAGSPFGTGSANELFAQFKRVSAIQGDYAFQSLRRLLLNAQSPKVPAFTYLIKRNKTVPFLGASHGSDIPSFFVGGEMQDYLIHFGRNFNPNAPAHCATPLVNWPKYDTKTRPILTLYDAPTRTNVTADNFRANATDLIASLFMQRV